MIRMWVKFMPFILVEYVATKMGQPYQVSDKMVFLTVEDWRNLDALRAELAAARDTIKSSAEYCKKCPQRAARDAEIERLREAVISTDGTTHASAMGWRDMCVAARAEIARLRGVVRSTRHCNGGEKRSDECADCPFFGPPCGAAHAVPPDESETEERAALEAKPC